MIEAAALEGTPYAPLPATIATYIAPQPMDAPITPHTISPTAPRLSSSRFFLQILHQILTVTLTIYLLGTSPRSDEDEQGGHSSNQYTIGLVFDCPTVTMHAGERFKPLINSETALSLVCTSICNMIEDCYKTKILPAAVT